MGLLTLDADRLDLLRELGWKPVLTQMISAYESLVPCRVVEVHRSGLIVAPAVNEHREVMLGGRWFNVPAQDRPTVGDWILVDPDTQSIEVLLERSSLIKRLAPGGDVQPIAANIDTAFLVTSCNSDFSLERLERYLAAVRQQDIQAVVVCTKSDLADEPEHYREQARSLDSDVVVEVVNALDPESVSVLAGWCAPGQSIALLGSSGVGKSTLVNALYGRQVQATQASRSGDDKGRHTTTHRSLHKLPQGGVILDSPGMREFQITDSDSGVQHVFADIEDLALDCKFRDCGHQSEPGCSVRGAMERGELDPRRLDSYFKLLREDKYNSESIAERHARLRSFGKAVKDHIGQKPKHR